jgi:iron complex outermembrane recepter protein
MVVSKWNRVLGRKQSSIFLALSLPIFWISAASAKPIKETHIGILPSPQAATTRAKDLIESSQAGDLRSVPALWDWSNPVTQPQISQATPPATAPAKTAAAPAPAAEDDDFLAEVSVTANRRPTRARDSTQSVNVIKREDFQAQGAVTVSDALLLIPGFNNSTPALGGQSNLSANFLRGFGDTEYVVLRDGVRLGSPFNGRSDVSAIVLDDLEKIEVITGGSTLRYGAGSVGGVINLITQTPKGPPKITFSYEHGSYSFNRFVGKYSGGDDTLSYNLIFTGIAAKNDYPFGFTLPTTPQFYGPDDKAINPSCPEGSDSCANGGVPDGSLLYGYLKPDVGPPLKVQGINNLSTVGNDNYSAKVTYKPSANNKLTFRLNQQSTNFGDRSPGYYDFNICGFLAGPTTATNGTYNQFDRFLPLDSAGREQRCPVQTYLPVTPSSNFGTVPPYSYSKSVDGRVSFPTGQPYGIAEQAQGDDSFFRKRNTSAQEGTVSWDYDINKDVHLNSYFSFFRQALAFSRATEYFYNTDVFLNSRDIIAPGIYRVPPVRRPFIEGQRFEGQSALDIQVSPGQTLTLGVNFVQDKISVVDNLTNSDGTRVYQNPRDFATSRISVFLVDDIGFSDLLKANFGLRYTNSDQYGALLTPAAGLRLNLSDNFSLRSNYSQVFTAPSLTNLYISTGTYGQNAGLPNQNLKPERGITYDIGLDWSPARSVSVKLTYFNTYVDDYFQTATFINPNRDLPGASPTLTQSVNLGSYRGSGIEFATDWQMTEQWRTRLVWTNVDARPYGNYSDDIDSISYPNFKEFQNYNLPFNSVVAALTYANKGFTATLLGRYDSGKFRFRGDSSTKVPAWFTLDLNSEIPISPNFTFTFSVQNLTDTQYEYLDANPAPGLTWRVGGRIEIGG